MHFGNASKIDYEMKQDRTFFKVKKKEKKKKRKKEKKKKRKKEKKIKKR